MISSNVSNGTAPITVRPLMNIVGVDDTPYSRPTARVTLDQRGESAFIETSGERAFVET